MVSLPAEIMLLLVCVPRRRGSKAPAVRQHLRCGSTCRAAALAVRRLLRVARAKTKRGIEDVRMRGGWAGLWFPRSPKARDRGQAQGRHSGALIWVRNDHRDRGSPPL
jgi:hypothetical protein